MTAQALLPRSATTYDTVFVALSKKAVTRGFMDAGLRTLSPQDATYRPHCDGGVIARDGAYHQGTVWPWLNGAFVEAWLNVHRSTPATRAEARTRFITPLHEHFAAAGVGHISEIADGDPPHTPRGCPWQAWSLGELLRMTILLQEPKTIPQLPTK